MVVALAANERGTGFICGHDDGSIIRYYINEDTGLVSGRLIQHQTSPVALVWANQYIVAAGCDRKIFFYDAQVRVYFFFLHNFYIALNINFCYVITISIQGRQSRLFDYSREDNEKEFTTATCSPNGQAVAVGSFSKIRIFTWSPRQSAWNELAAKEIPQLYSVTAMSWRRDGAR